MFAIFGPGWVIHSLEAVIFDKDGAISDIQLHWGGIIRRRAGAVATHYGLSEDTLPQLCAAMGRSLTEQRLLPQRPVGLASRGEVAKAVCGCRGGIGAATGQIHPAELQEYTPNVAVSMHDLKANKVAET
jgi:hypothetical protein